VPLYTYVCEDCGQRLEILHPKGRDRSTCGLDCRRQGPGAFGKGRVRRVVSAVNISSGRPALDQASIGDLHREALRRKGLKMLGGELTEQDLDRLRDKGIAVYRKDGDRTWAKDGGDPILPAMLGTGEGEA